MISEQWQLLLDIVQGKENTKPTTGFIIDSSWLPGCACVSMLEYYTSDKIWFETNKKAIETFPETMFLPGFWSEYGMCTEPSAFGAKVVWNDKNLPHANRIIKDISEIDQLEIPTPQTDGLLPFAMQRLKNCHPAIKDLGHEIKFAISRGPLNIASFLMGTTEFMMGLMLDPEKSHRLMEMITEFSIRWIQYQKELFPSIEGILLLDDIVGFIGDNECREFAVPYIQRIYQSFDSKINFFHNDAQGLVSSPYLQEMGINLFNFSFEHSMSEIRKLAGKEVALIGNLPPRDVLAKGSAKSITEETQKMVNDFGNNNRVIWSCGGGMPQNVSSQNIHAFINTIHKIVPKL